jgi:hypothetical protein
MAVNRLTVAEVNVVITSDTRFDLARIRRTLREIDEEMRRIEADDRLFHRYGFGSEVHNIQLTALRAERRDVAAQLVRARQDLGITRSDRLDLRSWLMLPAALGAIALQALRPRRRRVTLTPIGEPMATGLR